MHCGVMVTGYNQGDWDRLMKGDYDRPPDVSDAENMDNTLYMGELVEPLGFDSIWATEHYGSCLFDAAEPIAIPGVLGGAHQPSGYGYRSDCRTMVEPSTVSP